MVAYVCDPSTQEAWAGGVGARGQPRVHATLSEKEKKYRSVALKHFKLCYCCMSASEWCVYDCVEAREPNLFSLFILCWGGVHIPGWLCLQASGQSSCLCLPLHLRNARIPNARHHIRLLNVDSRDWPQVMGLGFSLLSHLSSPHGSFSF